MGFSLAPNVCVFADQMECKEVPRCWTVDAGVGAGGSTHKSSTPFIGHLYHIYIYRHAITLDYASNKIPTNISP